MGFAAMAQASGSANRAEAELNLLTKENQNRLRVNDSVSTARGAELDGRAREAVESSRKYIDTFLQLRSAEEAEEAAKWGFWASFVDLATKIGSSVAQQGKLTLKTLGNALIDNIGGVFSTLGAWFALQGASDEVELLKGQFGIISKSAKEDQNMVSAMDGNPTL